MFALVAREALRAASVRAVAAEVGWSPGAVRHYFSAQHDLLAFAMAEMDARIAARVMALPSRGEPGEARALAVLEQLLPLDAERRREVAVYVEFVVVGRTDTRLAQVAVAAWRGEQWLVRVALADALGLAVPRDAVTPLPEPAESAVDGLHAVVDGLTLAGAAVPGELGPVAVRSVLAEALAVAVERAGA